MEMPVCPNTSGHSEGGKRKGDLELRVLNNRRDESIVWWLMGCVVHQRPLNDFEQEGFTGYRTRPAKMKFRDGTISEEHKELVITGWAGLIRPESGVHVVEECPACLWKRYSSLTNSEQVIDWKQWTGDDFFVVWPLPLFTLITPRVAAFLLQQKAKSYSLQGLEEIQRVNPDSGFTVGRLSGFLPEDLAIKYGGPLGIE